MSPAADPVASGAALQAAVQSLSTVTPAPSATNPYEVFLEPGTYDLNGAALTVPAYVQLSGAGQSVTTITSAGDLAGVLQTGGAHTVVAALTARAINTQGGHAIGLMQSSGDTTLDSVTIVASGGTGATLGIDVAGGTLTVDESTVTASDSTYDDVGIYAQSGTLAIRNSTVRGTGSGTAFGTGALRVVSATVHVATSDLGGGVTSYNSNLACVGSYDDAYTPLNATCG